MRFLLGNERNIAIAIIAFRDNPRTVKFSLHSYPIIPILIWEYKSIHQLLSLLRILISHSNPS